jgi:hypothetical protein
VLPSVCRPVLLDFEKLAQAINAVTGTRLGFCFSFRRRF